MSTCCHDPTEPPNKIDPRDLKRAQMQYDELVRDLFTGGFKAEVQHLDFNE